MHDEVGSLSREVFEILNIDRYWLFQLLARDVTRAMYSIFIEGRALEMLFSLSHLPNIKK